MNICASCNKETKNPKFCSRSCSTKYNNTKSPKREPEGVCIDCGCKISTQRTRCKACREFLANERYTITEKTCISCQTVKPINQFYLTKTGKIFSQCKQCSAKTANDYHRETKRKCIEYKGGKCQECGYDKHQAALQFHHRDPSQKDYTIGTFKKSFDDCKTELDKCVLLCANCHIEEHSKHKS